MEAVAQYSPSILRTGWAIGQPTKVTQSGVTLALPANATAIRRTDSSASLAIGKRGIIVTRASCARSDPS